MRKHTPSTDPGLRGELEPATRPAGLRRGLSVIHDRSLPWPIDPAFASAQEVTDAIQNPKPDYGDRGIARIARHWQRKAEDANIYMVRWLLARIFGWEFKFNLFLASDPGCLHDHPWPFLSVMLAGSYTEITQEPATDQLPRRRTMRRTYSAPCILYRPARWKHRIEITEPCLTFNISAPRRRNWGFWTTHSWIRHDHYLDGKHEC